MRVAGCVLRAAAPAQPAPYEFLFNLGEGEFLVGASPEMYVRVTGDRVETCPIAGTIARGEGPLEDAANIATLLGSAKEESELTMCTDVDRNDKARICVPGSVRVIGRRQIEMYSRLIHTVDHIEGKLRPGFDAFDALLTHMWAVTVTGAPKTWAMQFIEDHEETPRRWYGGAVGKIGFDGSMNTGLTLRTAHITGGVAAVRAGATLLYDSVPEAEEKETHIKARALLETLEEASRIAEGLTGTEPRTAEGSVLAAAGARARDCDAEGTPRRSPGLVRAYARRLLQAAGRRGDHAAVRVPARRCLTPTRRTWSYCRPGRDGPPTSAARRCWTRCTRGSCRSSASAWACRPWWSTPGESCPCCPNPRTASRGWCGCPGDRCWRAARRVHRGAVPQPVRAGRPRSSAGSRDRVAGLAGRRRTW